MDEDYQRAADAFRDEIDPLVRAGAERDVSERIDKERDTGPFHELTRMHEMYSGLIR